MPHSSSLFQYLATVYSTSTTFTNVHHPFQSGVQSNKNFALKIMQNLKYFQRVSLLLGNKDTT